VMVSSPQGRFVDGAAAVNGRVLKKATAWGKHLFHHYEGDRSVLSVHPRDDPSRPRTGVFSTRSSDRPNPVGLHVVTITGIDGTTIDVRDLEAVDGTPVIDIKPVLGPER